MCICDTCILIDFLRHKENIMDTLLIRANDGLAMSVITYMELIIGARNKKEVDIIKKTFCDFTIIELDERISQKAKLLIEKFSKSHGLLIPDALIGATSVIAKIPLWTQNIRDFKFIPDIKLL